MRDKAAAKLYTGVPSGLTAAFSFSLSELLSDSSTLYKVAMVPTNTSLAAKEVTKAIPIFQSKPMGSINGSNFFPKIPA